MAGIRHRVVVDFNEKWLQRQTIPGGSIYDTTYDATEQAVWAIRNEIWTNHNYSGMLGKSFRRDMNRRDRTNVFGMIRNSAPHASFFFYGTGSPITALNEGGVMGLRVGYDGKVFARRREVSGQPNKEKLLRAAVKEGIREVVWAGRR